MRLLLGLAALATLCTGPALADCTISLSGDQEAPDPVSPAGTGSATIFADSVTRTVTVSGSYSGMTSNVIAAHIHGPAAPGVNAGVLISLTTTGGTSGTMSGGGILSVANFDALLAGNLYVNVHTLNNSNGEIRGQIDCTLVAATATSRNGTGVNPVKYTTSEVPQLGTTWDATIDKTGVQATAILFFLGPPIPNGFNLSIGQLLCAPPKIGTLTSLTGAHSLMIPNDDTLMGLHVCTQGATVNGGNVQLVNAIDLVLGI